MPLIELDSERRALISELAEDVWQTYSRERQAFLDGIANDVGISLSYGNYGEAFDGLLEQKAGTFHIYCNTARGQPSNSPRARFTLAHELGHFFIDEHRNALLAGVSPHCSFLDHPSDNPAEVEANLFAAHLLMPSREFEKALGEISKGLGGVRDLASTFSVSVQSAALQFVLRGGAPCAIIMFREAAKPWWAISPSLKGAGYQRIQKLTSDSISPDSATGMAIKDDADAPPSLHKTGTLASCWFADVANGSRLDRIFHESAFRLGSRGVLAMLEPGAF